MNVSDWSYQNRQIWREVDEQQPTTTTKIEAIDSQRLVNHDNAFWRWNDIAFFLRFRKTKSSLNWLKLHLSLILWTQCWYHRNAYTIMVIRCSKFVWQFTDHYGINRTLSCSTASTLILSDVVITISQPWWSY